MESYGRSRYSDLEEKDPQFEEARRAEYARRMEEYFDQKADSDEDED